MTDNTPTDRNHRAVSPDGTQIAGRVESSTGDIKRLVEVERTIDAPIEDVFARVTNAEDWTGWVSSSFLKESTQTSPGPPTVGTTVHDTMKYGLSNTWEIVEFESPHKVVYFTIADKVGIHLWSGYLFEAVDEHRTQVLHFVDARTHGVRKVLVPLLKFQETSEHTKTIDSLEASFHGTQ